MKTAEHTGEYSADFHVRTDKRWLIFLGGLTCSAFHIQLLDASFPAQGYDAVPMRLAEAEDDKGDGDCSQR